MAIAWTPLTTPDAAIPLPAGFTPEQFDALAPGDRRLQTLLAATFCTSLDSEIAVNDCGVRSARRWIHLHYPQIPRLMLGKALALIQYFHPLVISSVLLGVVAFALLRDARRILRFAWLIIAFYVLAIMFTHVVLARFLVPILPMLFLVSALGAAAVFRLIANFIRFTNRRRAGRVHEECKKPA
jgi:hypothetical protein